MLIILAAGAGLATWLLVFGILGRDTTEKERREELLARVRGDHPDRRKSTAASGVERRGLFGRGRPTLALKKQQQGLMARLEQSLRHAGMQSQPREFLATVLLVAALFAVLGNAFGGAPGLGGGFLLGIGGAWFLVRRRGSRRAERINGQLVDLLQVVAGGLTAGQSFLQAIASASKEIGDPIGAELQLLMNEVELGATLEGAFERLRERVHDEDLSLVIDAVLIQRRVGGNLAEVLTNISWTIRERIRIRGEVKALTGQATMSGWLLSGLPVGLAAILTFMNPEYMTPLFTTPLGRMLLGAGVVSETFGFVVMRKIANVKV
jgi:tight adherence protein B